jgi:glycerate kinase
VSSTVRDPLGRPVAAKYALVSQGAVRTAVLDMSEASGLWRVAPDERRVERQSTYGTGEMLAHALGCSGADRVVIGLGGSATALADGTVSAAEAIRRAPELLRARAAELAARWRSSLSR